MDEVHGTIWRLASGHYQIRRGRQRPKLAGGSIRRGGTEAPQGSGGTGGTQASVRAPPTTAVWRLHRLRTVKEFPRVIDEPRRLSARFYRAVLARHV
jgi:hypothetical protein